MTDEDSDSPDSEPLDGGSPWNVLRTPAERFAELPGFGFAPNYADIDGLRMHYVDAGPRKASPVVLLHGEPSWSYLYREMLPILVEAGHRVIAPDLIGFGRSDKPADRSVHTYAPSDVLAAYEAPFPDESYKAGPRALPAMVPTAPDDPEARANRTAWRVLSEWEKPFLTLFGAEDPITAGAENVFQQRIPGASGQPHHVFPGTGHFLQEDRGPEIARRVLAFMGGAAEEDPAAR